MVIERIDDGVLIKTNSPFSVKALALMIDYIHTLEAAYENRESVDDATVLAEQASKKWWAKSSRNFLDDNEFFSSPTANFAHVLVSIAQGKTGQMPRLKLNGITDVAKKYGISDMLMKEITAEINAAR